jgi:hypothetical protein
MLACGAVQFISVEINHMTWQSHLMLRCLELMARHG